MPSCKINIYWRGKCLGQGVIMKEDQLQEFQQEVRNQLWLSPTSKKASWLEYKVEKNEGQELGLEQETTDPRVRWSDTDGGVFGVRFFNAMPSTAGKVLLVSPTSGFIWLEHRGIARDFKNQGAVRGHVGFHAAWPSESLERWVDSEVDHNRTQVKALVKGYGDLVLGDMGWRSEKLDIISLQAENPLAEELAITYPAVSVIIGEPENHGRGPVNKFKLTWAGGVEWTRAVISPRRGSTLIEFEA